MLHGALGLAGFCVHDSEPSDSIKAGILLTRWAIVSFSRNTLFLLISYAFLCVYVYLHPPNLRTDGQIRFNLTVSHNCRIQDKTFMLFFKFNIYAYYKIPLHYEEVSCSWTAVQCLTYFREVYDSNSGPCRLPWLTFGECHDHCTTRLQSAFMIFAVNLTSVVINNVNVWIKVS